MPDAPEKDTPDTSIRRALQNALKDFRDGTLNEVNLIVGGQGLAVERPGQEAPGIGFEPLVILTLKGGDTAVIRLSSIDAIIFN